MEANDTTLEDSRAGSIHRVGTLGCFLCVGSDLVPAVRIKQPEFRFAIRGAAADPT
jgi:hypothetical protein